MIAQTLVDDVRRLLGEGRLSQRKIAARTGVSRGTVGAIAAGRRPDYAARRLEQFDSPSGPPVRCPGCGGRVRMPCLLCRLRGR